MDRRIAVQPWPTRLSPTAPPADLRRRPQRVLEIVRFPQPVDERRLDFVAVRDVNDVDDLRLRAAVDAADQRRLHRAAEEDADLQKASLGTHEEVAGLAREHD